MIYPFLDSLLLDFSHGYNPRGFVPSVTLIPQLLTVFPLNWTECSTKLVLMPYEFPFPCGLQVVVIYSAESKPTDLAAPVETVRSLSWL